MSSWLQRGVGAVVTRLLRPLRPTRPTLRQIHHRGVECLVFANEDVGWRLLTRGAFEEFAMDVLEGQIQTSDVCVDVGANVGLYSLLMARRASQGRVVAFEPLPLNRSVLGLNLELNGVHNVEVRGGVLSEVQGPVEFHRSRDGAYSSLRPTGRSEVDEMVCVPSTTLDAVAEELGGRVDVVKLDVEGGELAVLRSGARLLTDPQRRPRVLLVELDSRNTRAFGYDPREIVTFLGSLGYRAFGVGPSGIREGWEESRRFTEALFLR